MAPGSTDGDRWNGMFHPADRERAWEVWRHSLETGEPYHIEYRLRYKTGEYRWVIGRAQCVRDEQGRIQRWYGTCTDVHDLKTAEEQLRRNQETFYNLIKNDPFGVYVVDADFKLVVISRGSEAVFKSVKPLIGRDFAEVLRVIWEEPFASEAIKRFQHTLATGEPYNSPRTIERRGDVEEVEAYDWRIERILLPDGRHGIVCYFYDLSDRMRWEEALRASEEKHRRIFEQTSDLIITSNLDQIITACNPAAAAALGLTREQAVGRNISEFLSPEDHKITRKMLQTKLEQGGTTRYELRVRSAGDWRYWEINSGLIFDETGSPVGTHVVGRDITERKRLERHQQILVAELNHRVKNTLSIVQSLAHQTFGKESPPRDAIATFEGRLKALSAAHNLLTAQSWEAASLGAVIRTALAPFCLEERCQIEGPEVALPPETAVSLTLAIHELATNASKYGALSSDTGRVSVVWTADAGRLELRWRERGGPPVERLGKTGFGTKMIKRTLAAAFRAEIELDFASAGFECIVVGTLPETVATGLPDVELESVADVSFTQST